MKHESMFDIWTAKAAISSAIRLAREEGLVPDAQAIAAGFGAGEQALLRRLLEPHWKAGRRAATHPEDRNRARALLMASHEGNDLLNDAAFLVGFAGDELTLRNLVEEFIQVSAW